MSVRDKWRWCNKCQALAFAGNGALGACPAGGQHNHTGSGDYGLVQNDISMSGQNNWRWGEPGVGADTVLHDAYMSALKPRP
jgi:hypothetical protein